MRSERLLHAIIIIAVKVFTFCPIESYPDKKKRIQKNREKERIVLIHFGDDNILYAVLPEYLDEDTTRTFMNTYVEEVNKRPVINILIDTLPLAELPSTRVKLVLFREAKKLRPPHPKDRVACLVKSKFHQMFFNSMLIATGNQHTRVYQDRKEAFTWLGKV